MSSITAVLGRFPPWAVTLAACLAVGALAALAHPPFGFLPGLLAYGGLMLLADRAGSLRSVFWRGWLAGLTYFAIGCYWVAEAFLVDAKTFGWMAPFAVAFLAAGLALFWAGGLLAYRLLVARCAVGVVARVVVFAGALSGLEWLRGHVLTGFPWNLPGTTWAAGSPVSQFAGVAGAYGLTWVTLAIAAAPALLAEDWRGRKERIAVGAAAAGLAGLYLAGVLATAHAYTDIGREVAPIRVVQPNIPQLAEYDEASETSIAADYVRMTALPRPKPGPMLVIWPEGALPQSALVTPDADLDLARRGFLAPGQPVRAAIEQALQPGDILLVGAIRVQRLIGENRYFNSLIAVERTAGGLEIRGVYDKHRMVPFGEYLPMQSLLHAVGFQQLIPISDGLSSGPPPRPLAVGKLKLQPLICYEALFPGFTGAGSRASGTRPGAIVNVSTDAWFGRTSGPLQHLNQAAYRAIEEGLPEVRATPTGVSAIINARGQVEHKLDLGARAVIDATLPAFVAPTLYSRFGDMIFIGMLSVSCLICLYSAVLKHKNA